jgi:hypothetical protein
MTATENNLLNRDKPAIYAIIRSRMTIRSGRSIRPAVTLSEFQLRSLGSRTSRNNRGSRLLGIATPLQGVPFRNLGSWQLDVTSTCSTPIMCVLLFLEYFVETWQKTV